jgi:hypothetical protein
MESLEAKKCYLFLRCCLARDENALAKSSPDVKMLEDLDSAENGCWLRRCSRLNGEDGLGTRTDHVDANGSIRCRT